VTGYLIVTLPGGPYRVDAAPGPTFTASEICLCPSTTGPHWHELGLPAAGSITDLMADLLARFLEGAPS
jgi:hypothetical protein